MAQSISRRCRRRRQFPRQAPTASVRPPQRPIVYDGTYADGKLMLTSQGRNGEVKSTGKKSEQKGSNASGATALATLKNLPDNSLVHTPPIGWNSWNKFTSKN